MTVGTNAFAFDQYRNGVYTISGIAATGVTTGIRSFGFVIGSWAAVGLTATGLTAQLYGSNDATNYFALEASAHATDGLFGLITEPGPGFNNVVPLYYRWAIAGTEGTGSLTITAVMMSTFG
jgi:hypothetical protein